MDDHDSAQDPASERPATAPAETHASEPTMATIDDPVAQRSERRGQMLGKVIAALRRGGLDCCVVLTEGETPASAEPAPIPRKMQ